MKTREHFDDILLSCRDRIQEEISALTGKVFELSEPEFRHIDKKELFAGSGGREMLMHVGLEGDIQGHGCVLVGIDDAIHISSTFTMPPEPEQTLSLGDDPRKLHDACATIGKTLCGAVTAILDTHYSPAKKVRLVSGTQEIVTPTDVVIASEQPVPDIPYYLMTTSIRLDGRELGPLRLVLPALPLGLEDSGGMGAAPDAATRKEFVDSLLKDGLTKICEDLKPLFSGALEIVPVENRVVGRGEFLGQAGGRQMMIRMEIKGDSPGEAYLFVEDKTAIYLGGTLIMLPEVELEDMVRNGQCTDEVRDAYGEVADIIVAACSSLFEGQYAHPFGLNKASMESVDPAGINPDTDDVLTGQAYYLATGQIRYKDRDLRMLQLLIPAGVLALEGLSLADGDTITPAIAASADKPILAGSGDGQEQPEEEPDILLFTDDDGEAGRIADMLSTMGYRCRVLHFKDSVHSVMKPGIRIVFLVMRETSELGFGVAIKINSAGLSVPLVAAGPSWTRNMVLKAVKYGACDILVTPVSPGDVQEKIRANVAAKIAVQS